MWLLLFVVVFGIRKILYLIIYGIVMFVCCFKLIKVYVLEMICNYVLRWMMVNIFLNI